MIPNSRLILPTLVLEVALNQEKEARLDEEESDLKALRLLEGKQKCDRVGALCSNEWCAAPTIVNAALTCGQPQIKDFIVGIYKYHIIKSQGR